MTLSRLNCGRRLYLFQRQKSQMWYLQGLQVLRVKEDLKRVILFQYPCRPSLDEMLTSHPNHHHMLTIVRISQVYEVNQHTTDQCDE